RRHSEHLFGDMVNTFFAGYTYRPEMSRKDALESEFHHVRTSSVRIQRKGTSHRQCLRRPAGSAPLYFDRWSARRILLPTSSSADKTAMIELRKKCLPCLRTPVYHVSEPIHFVRLTPSRLRDWVINSAPSRLRCLVICFFSLQALPSSLNFKLTLQSNVLRGRTYHHSKG